MGRTHAPKMHFIVSHYAMVEMLEGRGLLDKKLYCVYTKPTNGLGPIMEHIEDHLAYQY
jgi:hypothetical protein